MKKKLYTVKKNTKHYGFASAVLYFGAMAAMSLLLAGCSPDYSQEYIIKLVGLPDDGVHREVKFVMTGPYTNYSNGTYVLNDDTVQYRMGYGEMGCTDRQSLEWFITHQVLGDSVQMIRYDTVLAVWYPSDTTDPTSPYNFNSPHYDYYEHSIFTGCAATYNCFIWTVTYDMIRSSRWRNRH